MGVPAQSLQDTLTLRAAITPKGHHTTRITRLHSTTLTSAGTGIACAILGLNCQRPDSCTVQSRAAEVTRALGASPGEKAERWRRCLETQRLEPGGNTTSL